MTKYQHRGTVDFYQPVPEAKGGGFWVGLGLIAFLILLLSQCGH